MAGVMDFIDYGPGGGPASTNAASPSGPGGTVEQNNIFNQISRYLSDMDLGGLFSVTNGQPGGWLWDQITSGIDDQAVIQLNLEGTQQFQTRYGVIADVRAQAASGQAVHVPTVAQVREYEQTVASSMRQAGLPSFMYDNYADMQQLMRQGLSAVEVEQRLGQTWERVQNTDPMVRQQFDAFFGVQGDAALAAMFLDPAKTLSSLERMSRTAYTAGMGSRMGVSLDQATADRIAGSPSTDAGIYQDLGTLGGLQGSGIFNESFGESGQDLTAQGTGVDAVFGGGVNNSQADIEKRRLERAAVGQAAQGGGVRTAKGLTGAGSTSTQ
jgi:hypothetical protein